MPTMFAAMLHSTERPDTGSLRLCVSGGAAMPVEVMRGFEQPSAPWCSRGTA
ncbi:long-chain-fatty-acid--CoA ligase domain protein [Mycobacterium ulcerans str. Harvey]|uniref:Long-chain-fatty-acid--CoA ligase domain protein n=1 Tax=Mycobacterium ulcerans str. Harvey TaxID=1299332 RepID=A0ABN0RA91_MYCUL|nr:long-chain-fatty-acid--CoA ligase domain protein [Mycobacterium ulcerans str. Harvey]